MFSWRSGIVPQASGSGGEDKKERESASHAVRGIPAGCEFIGGKRERDEGEGFRVPHAGCRLQLGLPFVIVVPSAISAGYQAIGK